MIEVENVEAIHRGGVNADGRTLGTKLSPAEIRRNFATSGVLLDRLVDQEFRVGDVIRPPDGLNRGGQTPGDHG